MDAPAARRLPNALLCLVLLQLALSAAFIVAFAHGFGFGRRLIVLHLVTLSASGALAALGLYSALRRFPSAAARRLVAALIAALGMLLWSLYAADAVSNRYWKHNVTYELAARYLARPRVLADYARLAIGWPVLAAASALLTAALAVVLRSRALDDALRRLQAQAKGQSRRITMALALSVAVLSALAAAIVITLPAGHSRRLLLQKEPLAGFFIEPERPDWLGIAALEAQYRTEGPLVRSSYGVAQDFDRRNVILIVVDSLRSDHMSLYGYSRRTTPFLERLKDRGGLRVVERALATCTESRCGIASILTSKTFGSTVPENFKMHELLKDQGYAVHFVLSGDHDWLGLREFYGTGITTYFDGNRSRAHDPTDDRLILEGLDAVPAYSGQPAFFYFHLMSSHVIGVRQERHLAYQPSRTRTTAASYSSETREMRVNNYDNGVRQADAVIEELFGALDAKGYLRNATVVITSDHGEGLGERGAWSFGHTGWLYEEFIRIPLLVYEDGDAPYANLEFATQIDIAPTIVDRLGLPAPLSWEGRSLLQPHGNPYSHHALFDPPYQAIVHRTGGLTYKLLRQSGREELFELTRDPAEQRNLLGSVDEGLVRDLRERIDDAVTSRVRKASDVIDRVTSTR